MNVGQAITAGMRADRARDFIAALYGPAAWGDLSDRYRLQAWLWWGWGITPGTSLGFPGYELGGKYRRGRYGGIPRSTP